MSMFNRFRKSAPADETPLWETNLVHHFNFDPLNWTERFLTTPTTNEIRLRNGKVGVEVNLQYVENDDEVQAVGTANGLRLTRKTASLIANMFLKGKQAALAKLLDSPGP